MDPATTCYVVFGSLFGAACLIGNICLYCICHEPNKITPSSPRYEDLINKPPEYEAAISSGQAIEEQPLPPKYED